MPCYIQLEIMLITYSEKNIYFVIFDTNINYVNLMQGRNVNAVSWIAILQKSLKVGLSLYKRYFLLT